MPLTAIFTSQRPTIGGYLFDATLEESDELVTEVTQYPVENGDIANDHANNRNLRITMQVALSDNPFKALAAQASQSSVADNLASLGIPPNAVGALTGFGSSVGIGAATGLLGGAGAAFAGLAASIGNAAFAAGQAQTRSADALQTIRQLQRNRNVITIATSKATYDNVLITRTQRTTNIGNEKGLVLTVEMEQLRIFRSYTTLQSGVLPPGDSSSAQAQPYIDRGEISVQPLGDA